MSTQSGPKNPNWKGGRTVPVMNEAEWRALPLTPILNHRNHRHATYKTGLVPLLYSDKKGGELSEWPADLRVRQFPEVRA